MFRLKFQELFEEIFPTDGLINLREGEDFITNEQAVLREDYISPYGWEFLSKIKTRDWLYVCFTGKSNVYLVYLRIKEGKMLHFREKVKSTLSERIDLKKTYYKIIECLTYMTLTHDKQMQIVYNDGLLKINGETRNTFFSDKLQEE